MATRRSTSSSWATSVGCGALAASPAALAASSASRVTGRSTTKPSTPKAPIPAMMLNIKPCKSGRSGATPFARAAIANRTRTRTQCQLLAAGQRAHGPRRGSTACLVHEVQDEGRADVADQLVHDEQKEEDAVVHTQRLVGGAEGQVGPSRNEPAKGARVTRSCVCARVCSLASALVRRCNARSCTRCVGWVHTLATSTAWRRPRPAGSPTAP